MLSIFKREASKSEQLESVSELFRDAVKQRGNAFFDNYMNKTHFEDPDKEAVYEVGSWLVTSYTSFTDKEFEEFIKNLNLKIEDNYFVDALGNKAEIEKVMNETFKASSLCEMAVEHLTEMRQFRANYAAMYERNFKDMMKVGEALYTNYFSLHPEKLVSYEALSGENTWSIFKRIEDEISHLAKAHVPSRFMPEFKEDEAYAPESFIIQIKSENKYGKIEEHKAMIHRGGFEMKYILKDEEILNRISQKVNDGYKPTDYVLDNAELIDKPKLNYSKY